MSELERLRVDARLRRLGVRVTPTARAGRRRSAVATVPPRLAAPRLDDIVLREAAEEAHRRGALVRSFRSQITVR